MKKPIVAALTAALVTASWAAKYEATWESLDARPVPQWWTDAKFGIFVHWGPYSVPAYAPTGEKSVYECYAEWYHGKLRAGRKSFLEHHASHYGKAPYGNFGAAFTAENFKPAEWAELFRKAGAKYTVLTSKHHDGYALWPSPETPYFNAVALGSGRDLAGEFTSAMKAAGLRSGFYYSLLEYANANYPKARKYGDDTAKTAAEMQAWARNMNLPQMKELAENYKADIIWTDGEWDHPWESHLSTEFLAWLYNESSVRDTVVVNDRWGKGCRGHHGGHYTTEYAMDGGDQAGLSAVHPWEECRGIGRSFGYNRFETPEHYMSREKCVETLVAIVSGGGNLLLNVGPTSDGRIPAIMQDRLLAMGAWLKVNGEAIYATRRWADADKDAKKSRLYFTQKGSAIYAITFAWPEKPLVIPKAGDVKSVSLVGSDVRVDWQCANGVLTVNPPALAPGRLPCEYAWTFKVVR